MLAKQTKPSNQSNLLLLPTTFQQLNPTYPLSSKTSTEDPNPPLHTNLESPQKILIKTKRTNPNPGGLSGHLKFLLQQLPPRRFKTPKTQNLKTPPPSRSDVSRFTQPNGNPARWQNANTLRRPLAFRATTCLQQERGKIGASGCSGQAGNRRDSASTWSTD